MPDRKLSYKVDVDTGTAIRDLDKLGEAGKDVGKTLADGFDVAKSASKAAIDAISSTLDQVEADAKGAAAAIAAIKANLTVDIDDAAIGSFVGDLKGKMGVAFDQVEADAREFAAVLERGVDLSKTTGEIRGVGTALDGVHSNADQSRSVLANLAGNTAQDLGQLGGVVGSLGVGVGQLAEYAVDGNIKMSQLAGVAGPMAGLALAGAAVQSVMANIAATKAFNVQQVADMDDAVGDLGNSALGLQTALDGAFNVRVEDNSVMGQLLGKQETTDLADNLAAVGVQLSDIDQIIRSGVTSHAEWEMLPGVQDLDRVLQAAGISVDDYGQIMEGVWETTQNWTSATKGSAAAAEFFGSSLETINDALKDQIIGENPLAVMDWGLYQTGGHLVDLQAIWNDVVRDMSDDDASFETTAANVDVLAEAFHMTVPEVIALAREQEGYTKVAGDARPVIDDAAAALEAQAEAARENADAMREQATAIQEAIDKEQEMIDAAKGWADAQQAWRDAVAELPAVIEATNAMDEHEEGSAEWTAARNEQRDVVEQDIDLMVEARRQYDLSNGVVRSAVSTQRDYAEGLGRVAGTLDDDVIPSVAAYYADVLKIPPDKLTEFTMLLLEGDQEKIETFVAENSGTTELAVKVQADQAELARTNAQIAAATVDHTTTVKVEANTGPASATIDQLRKVNAGNAIHIPVMVTTTNVQRTINNSTKGQRSQAPTADMLAGNYAAELDAGDDVAAARGLAAPAMLGDVETGGGVELSGSGGGGFGFTPVAVAVPAPAIHVTVNAGVVGNRYDLQRWVRSAVRGQSRLGRAVVSSP